MPRFSEDPRVLTTDQIMESATGGPRRCLHCRRAVGEFHVPNCYARRQMVRRPLKRFVIKEAW